MVTGGFSKLWALVTVILIVIIVVGGIIAAIRYSPNQPFEISLSSHQEPEGDIYVDGAVAAPGFYPFTSTDSIGALLQTAGADSDIDLKQLRLYIQEAGQKQESQKIDINRAEVWLLEALPGIGETLAQRIVDYRQMNGPFRNTSELLKVAGIGYSTYEQIKDKITVAD
jgi:competence protein ComEA